MRLRGESVGVLCGVGVLTRALTLVFNFFGHFGTSHSYGLARVLDNYWLSDTGNPSCLDDHQHDSSVCMSCMIFIFFPIARFVAPELRRPSC